MKQEEHNILYTVLGKYSYMLCFQIAAKVYFSLLFEYGYFERIEKNPLSLPARSLPAP